MKQPLAERLRQMPPAELSSLLPGHTTVKHEHKVRHVWGHIVYQAQHHIFELYGLRNLIHNVARTRTSRLQPDQNHTNHSQRSEFRNG